MVKYRRKKNEHKRSTRVIMGVSNVLSLIVLGFMTSKLSKIK